MSFTMIKPVELSLWVKIYHDDGYEDPAEILKEIKLIDHLLILQKTKALLNRKRGLRDLLGARIGIELGHKNPNFKK